MGKNIFIWTTSRVLRLLVGHPPSRLSSQGLSWKWLFGAAAAVIGGVALSVYIAARDSAQSTVMM